MLHNAIETLIEMQTVWRLFRQWQLFYAFSFLQRCERVTGKFMIELKLLLFFFRNRKKRITFHSNTWCDGEGKKEFHKREKVLVIEMVNTLREKEVQKKPIRNTNKRIYSIERSDKRIKLASCTFLKGKNTLTQQQCSILCHWVDCLIH